MLRQGAATIGWGLFCASSWTWCIGMYLPIILIRWFGWPGLLVFLVPNVFGCAAFGYLCSRERSERIGRDHAPALALFSAVTIAFQVFFVAWVAREAGFADALGSGVPIGWLAAFICAAAALLVSLAPDRAWPWLGSIATFASLTLWLVLDTGGFARLPLEGNHAPRLLLYAAPIVVFGFLLCPWLDATFHRARRLAPSVHAFGVFGLSFMAVIVLTALYAEEGRALLLSAVLAHLLGQTTFTVAAHVRELRLARTPSGRRARIAAILLPIAGGALAADLPVHPETTYLLFLGAYGLLFPAYVLLFMAPAAWGGHVWPRSAAGFAAFAILVLALAPFAMVGFLELKTWLLPIPVVIVVVAALLVSRRSRPNPTTGHTTA
jgi:hypothetical protein